MADITLITGGARSGKSGYAQQLAEVGAGRKLYVATCPVTDDAEMRQRISKHRLDREGRDWETLEEETDLTAVFRSEQRCDVVLVDCLTLWVSNIMHEAEKDGETLTEDSIRALCEPMLHAARECCGHVIFVTNEVGQGIVPENAVARAYRDLAGRCNQLVASEADQVVLMVCGIPVVVKPSRSVL